MLNKGLVNFEVFRHTLGIWQDSFLSSPSSLHRGSRCKYYILDSDHILLQYVCHTCHIVLSCNNQPSDSPFPKGARDVLRLKGICQHDTFEKWRESKVKVNLVRCLSCVQLASNTMSKVQNKKRLNLALFCFLIVTISIEDSFQKS